MHVSGTFSNQFQLALLFRLAGLLFGGRFQCRHFLAVGDVQPQRPDYVTHRYAFALEDFFDLVLQFRINANVHLDHGHGNLHFEDAIQYSILACVEKAGIRWRIPALLSSVSFADSSPQERGAKKVVTS